LIEYFGKYDKKQTVELFVDNLIWGNISINSFAFQMDDAANFRRALEQNIIDFQKNPTEQTGDLIYEAIIRLRVHGALSDQLRDISTEEMINGLKEAVKQREGENATIRSENIQLVAELHKIETTEPPKKKGFNAVG
jgi:hypothetical protein